MTHCRETVRAGAVLVQTGWGNPAFLRFVHFWLAYAGSTGQETGFTRKSGATAGCVMLGLLISEFVNMVETRHGVPVADAILFGTDVPVSHDVDLLDHYPCAPLQVLVEALARRVGESPHAVLHALAGRVVSRIRLANPEVFARHADLFGQITASGEDVVLRAYEVEESDAEEIELLLGERTAAERLVRGLQGDLARYLHGPFTQRAQRRQATPGRHNASRARAIFR